MQNMIRASRLVRAMNQTFILAATALASVTLLADDKEKSDESSFIKEAALGNLMEVKLAQTASTKAESPTLKQLAERLQTDHKKANENLKTIADKHSVTIPTELDAKHQKVLEKFQGMSGANFDKEFVKHAIKHHRKDIAKFTKAAKDCKDPDLKSYVEENLPTLREHLRLSQEVARSLGLDAAEIAAAAREGDEEAAGAAAGEAETGKGEKKDDDKK